MKYECFNTEAREVAGEWLRKHMHVFSEPKKPEIPALDTSEKTYERIRELEIKVAIPILSKRRRLGEAIGLLEMFEERNRDVAPGVRHLIRAARFSILVLGRETNPKARVRERTDFGRLRKEGQNPSRLARGTGIVQTNHFEHRRHERLRSKRYDQFSTKCVGRVGWKKTRIRKIWRSPPFVLSILWT